MREVLADGVVVAIIIGLAAGGRLARLKELELRAPWLIVAAAVVQVGIMVAGAKGWDRLAGVGQAAVLATFALVLVWVWLNRRLPGMWVAGTGVALNLLVMAANGGSMPVDRELAVRAGNKSLVEMLDSPNHAKHRSLGRETRLRPLADVLPLPMIVPRPGWYGPGSVGDVLVTVGACWLVLAGMGAFGLRAAIPQRREEPKEEAEETHAALGGHGNGRQTDGKKGQERAPAERR